jgi:hypothetical protein
LRQVGRLINSRLVKVELSALYLKLDALLVGGHQVAGENT